MISSMSQGNRWCRVSSKLSLSTRFVCDRTSFSTSARQAPWILTVVCISSNQQQVPFFRCIRICKQGLLITLHLGTHYRLYCQETGSVRTTRCWLWFCTLWHCHKRHTEGEFPECTPILLQVCKSLYKVLGTLFLSPFVMTVKTCCLLSENELFTFKKSSTRSWGRSQCDKGIQDRVTSKIWVH